jgi:HPt (histidine-containing phosphotransfer) domain-containing protein
MARRDITGAVDFAHLETYTAGDAVLAEEVLGLFRHQAELWAPLLDPSAEGWRDAAHTLKGSALGIGAHRLGQVCGEAEQELDLGRRHLLLGRIRDELDAALHDIAAYLHERALQGLKTRR